VPRKTIVGSEPAPDSVSAAVSAATHFSASSAGVHVRAATADEVPAIQATRLSAAEELTDRFGEGQWSLVSSENTLYDALGSGTLYVIDSAGILVGTFRLTQQKIVFYQERWFADPNALAAYLRDMAIAPDHQRQGVGRQAMGAIEQLARDQGVRALRLDAYVGAAGAGPFYRKCGYTRVHKGAFNNVPLEYYEKCW
jgi:GNAT superfamily N-acetyltransferase